MTEKGSESPSSPLVIVSRKVLIAGIVGISVFSFGLGYFLGYGGNTANRLVKHVEADNRAVPSEERTVLDASGKPTMVPPPAIPSSVPKEPPLKAGTTARAGVTSDTPVSSRNVTEAASQQKGPAETVPDGKDKKTAGQDKGERNEKKPLQPADDKKADSNPADKRITAEAKKEPARTASKSSAVKKIAVAKKAPASAGKARSKKAYELQAGAFEDRNKAERLKKDLEAKGYKSHIMPFTADKGKTFSRVRIGPYENRDKAVEALSELKSQGIEGIIIFGPR